MKRLAAAVAVAALVLVAGGAAADTFAVRLISQDATTVTLGWDLQSGGYGYLFSANGVLVSRTNDPARTTVRFLKANTYEVALIVKGATGTYPTEPPPPPKAQCENDLDDDGDGKVDYPADPGCTSASDTDETNPAPPPPTQCADGKDNDGDGLIDTDDPGCSGAADNDETNVVQPPTTITAAQFQARATTGATIENVTVNGDVSISNPNVTVRGSHFSGAISVGGDNFKLYGSTAAHIGYLSGADGLLLDGNTFDGKGQVKDGITMWDRNGNAPSGWVFRNNVFRNFYVRTDSSAHSQAIYVGYSMDGLIENNTFENNGTTAHIFFTWWGDIANPATSYPRNVCVRGNTFRDGPDVFHYYDVNFRSEIPTSANIKIQPSASSTSPQFYGAC